MKIKALVLVPILAALTLAACGEDDDQPPARTLDVATLTVQTVNGTGCPTGAATSTTGDTVSATYSAFSVTAGGTGFRKVCQLNVLVHPGANRKGEVTSALHAGTATLPSGTSGTVKTTYYVTSGTNLAAPSTALTAPTWSIDQAVPGGAVTAACGQDMALNVKVELTVTGAGSSATAESSTVHFAWSDC